jgi:sodium/bile acid cotransporter 7
MCVTLTQSANGSAAAAIFNAVFGNFLGIFVSPLLILLILGAKTDFNFIPTVKKLAELVLLPVFTGQILRLTPVKKFMDKNKLITKTFGELILVAIVFNTFSDSFSRGIGTEMTLELKSLFVILPATYLVFNAVFWAVAHFLFPNIDVRTHAAAMICSSQKTLAFGLPFIKTAFSTRKDLSTILTPLLIFSPTQLFCATTILVPFLKREVAKADKDPISYYPRKKNNYYKQVSKDWGLRHKLKTVLTTVCLLSVFFELFASAVNFIIAQL